MNKIYIEQNNSLDFINWSNEQMVKNGLDPNKGFLILGQIGVGKTYAIKAYENALESNKGIKSYSISAFELMMIGEADGLSGLSQYINPYPMFVDDIGREAGLVKHFGNEIHPLQYIIFERHKIFSSYKTQLEKAENKIWYEENKHRYLTHFTSNADMDTLALKYGSYITDRLTEMCNVIVINGKSRRS